VQVEEILIICKSTLNNMTEGTDKPGCRTPSDADSGRNIKGVSSGSWEGKGENGIQWNVPVN
jgi:hypothetical protein